MSTNNLSGLAYKHISDELANGKLTPGQKISEPVLAKKLGISRTPVREAIQRLQNEGLLQQVPSSGTYVAQTNRAPLIETYEIRLALETMAVRKVAERIPISRPNSDSAEATQCVGEKMIRPQWLL